MIKKINYQCPEQDTYYPITASDITVFYHPNDELSDMYVKCGCGQEHHRKQETAWVKKHLKGQGCKFQLIPLEALEAHPPRSIDKNEQADFLLDLHELKDYYGIEAELSSVAEQLRKEGLLKSKVTS